MTAKSGRCVLVLLASFVITSFLQRQPSVSTASTIRDRCVVLMARLYRLYCIRGSQVFIRAVLQPLGVAVAARRVASNRKMVRKSAHSMDFFSIFGDGTVC
jgi:hypothetical protein